LFIQAEAGIRDLTVTGVQTCALPIYDQKRRLGVGDGPGKGRHYHIADAQSTFLIMQDSTKHWTLHAVVGKPEEMAAQFERTIGKIGRASCRESGESEGGAGVVKG